MCGDYQNDRTYLYYTGWDDPSLGGLAYFMTNSFLTRASMHLDVRLLLLVGCGLMGVGLLGSGSPQRQLCG